MQSGSAFCTRKSDSAWEKGNMQNVPVYIAIHPHVHTSTFEFPIGHHIVQSFKQRVLTERSGNFHDISLKIHMQTRVFLDVEVEIKPNQRSFMNDLLKIYVAVVTLVVIFGRGIIGIIWK